VTNCRLLACFLANNPRIDSGTVLPSLFRGSRPDPETPTLNAGESPKVANSRFVCNADDVSEKSTPAPGKSQPNGQLSERGNFRGLGSDTLELTDPTG